MFLETFCRLQEVVGADINYLDSGLWRMDLWLTTSSPTSLGPFLKMLWDVTLLRCAFFSQHAIYLFHYGGRVFQNHAYSILGNHSVGYCECEVRAHDKS